MSTITPNLDLSAFKAWLDSKDDGDEAGVACDGYNCPIANFIAAQGIIAYVEPRFIEIADQEDTIPTPIWARAFVETLDDAGEGVLTIGTAREVLTRIIGEEVQAS
jgi:hypothetical protein